MTTLTDTQALDLAGRPLESLPRLMRQAAALRDEAHPHFVTYSRKVFIPLTRLCRDVCHYCTFAKRPSEVARAYLALDEVLETARHARARGCKEALFTLGERPELRYAVAREELAQLGCGTTLEYVARVAQRVLEETGLLPHINPGTMTREELRALRGVSASMGIMLESASERLCGKGMPHHGSPDKQPAIRLETIALAGEERVPLTTGLLIGIGETRLERTESLLALRRLHDRHGHLQELIIQNYRSNPGTKMAQSQEPALEELLWTIAVARLVFGPGMSIQAPPNLNAGDLASLVDAGINDWGGVSPVTPDFVNPRSPWPHIDALADQTRAAGKQLVERLTIYPKYALDPAWVDPQVRPKMLSLMDAEGYARDEWVAGRSPEVPAQTLSERPASRPILEILARTADMQELDESQLVALFGARDDDFHAVCSAADALRRRAAGDTVRYVVNRNINYTNVCYFRCQFCAFSKGKTSEDLRGRPYNLDLDEIRRRVAEAWERGATEVCMQGGINPDYTGHTYLSILRAAKEAAPAMHVHAFSPLEITHGARTLGMRIEEYLALLRDEGLGSLPGTAAEILVDEVRAVICPDKLTSGEWQEVIAAAHGVGIPTTSTIMFGHVESTAHWAAHLRVIRDLQRRSGLITEFVPLPFVAHEAPIYHKGGARRGPSFREAVLMHAVARIALHGLIGNIQTSWVKMGRAGARACLEAGANDIGGTLMNESITRAAGALHGQEFAPAEIDAFVRAMGRVPAQRTTLYGAAPGSQVSASYKAQPLREVINTPLRRQAVPAR
jgi:FO synthase